MKMLNPSYLFYRTSTIFSSLKALYRLTPQQVQNFINSYDIYDYDWVNGQAVKHNKVMNYSEVKGKIIDWYGVLNHLCAIGEVEKMYIPPALDLSASVIENQLLFEKRFSRQLGMKAGDKVLDFGCGKGRVAAHLASYTGAHVTGINIDQGQLDNATAFAKRSGLAEQTTFLNADFNDLPLPFADQSFDCLYEIQAMSLSKDLSKLFKEMYRILKPGGKLSLLDWVQLPKYDPNNPRHVDLMRRIKPLIGAIGTPTPQELENVLKAAGFKVLVSEEPSVNAHQGPLIDKASSYYDLITNCIKFLVKTRIIPKHFDVLFERLSRDSESLQEAEKEGLVTTSYHIIAQKTK